MQWVRDFKPQPEISSLYRQALIVTVVGNVLLAAAKGVVAYISNSVALYADAANSASDVLYSLLMVLGLWLAQRPPDLSHPQGHARFEPLIGLVVSASMAFAGYEAARTSVTRFAEGGLAVEPGLPTVVLLSSAAIKAGMFAYINNIARKVSSPALVATARDNLSDVLTSTAAFVGAIGSKFIHPLLDASAGVVVAAWIFRNVYFTLKENLRYITGAGADAELRNEIIAIAEGVPGVIRVHHLMTDYVGPKFAVDLHINVNGDMTLNEAHAISDKVIEQLQTLPEIDRAYVHIEPHDWQE